MATVRRVAVRRRVFAVYALLGVALAGYLISLLVRPAGSYSTDLDGWLVDAVELLASLLCIGRALLGRPGRLVAVVLGCALLSWCAGDIALTVESLGGRTPPTPSIADAFYLAFYPLAYVAVVVFIRGETRRLTTPSWLDGGIAGLGVGALCAAFAFRGIVRSTHGSTAATITNLAYPIGDLLLLGLVAGSTVVLAGRRKTPWVLLGSGLALNAIGDTTNLFQHSLATSQTADVLNAIAWPTATVLMSLAVWVRPRAANPLALQRLPGFALPEIAAAGALGVLLFGSLHPTDRVALGLATATIAAVGVRVGLSARSLRALSHERRRQSVTDELTGLGNRRYLFQVLDAFFADVDAGREPAGGLAFLFVDLNHFKEINDSFGHPAGDELLRQLGPRLTEAIGPSDVAIRLGGDEFAVLLIESDADSTAAVAHRLADRIREPFRLGSVNATIGASIGIATAPADAADGDSLVFCADIAMYRAKLSNLPFAVFEQDLDEQGNRLGLASELRAAIAEHELVLHFQPQLDLATREVSAVEALVRWRHPRLGLLAPFNFLPLAEETGLMRSLTAFVLDQALTQCAAWRAAGTPVAVSVNISATNLLDRGFAASVAALLERHRLPGEALVLEITETSVISEFERARLIIEDLQRLGLVVSIDDFGAGFTSLAYLNSLAVGELKLDRTFISSIAVTSQERDCKLVRATIDLGHALGLRIVAEGVEDGRTLDMLAAFGCDRAQGEFIGGPRPAPELRLGELAAADGREALRPPAAARRLVAPVPR